MKQHQGQTDFITLITVGSTKFETLVHQTVKSDFFNAILTFTHIILSSKNTRKSQNQSSRSEDFKESLIKNSLMIQIGHSSLAFDEELIPNLTLNDTQQDQKHDHPPRLQEEIERFNSGLITHLNLVYSAGGLGKDDQHHQLEVLIFRFSDSIDSLLSISNLIISHAGSGSILASIKPNQFSLEELKLEPSIRITNDFQLMIDAKDMIETKLNTNVNGDVKIESFRQLIIVPNRILMDNHQVDLANEISNLGLALTCEPDQIVATIQKIQADFKLNTTKNIALNDHQIILTSNKFSSLIDRLVGFGTNLD